MASDKILELTHCAWLGNIEDFVESSQIENPQSHLAPIKHSLATRAVAVARDRRRKDGKCHRKDNSNWISGSQYLFGSMMNRNRKKREDRAFFVTPQILTKVERSPREKLGMTAAFECLVSVQALDQEATRTGRPDSVERRK
jgi:hypothetical protein